MKKKRLKNHGNDRDHVAESQPSSRVVAEGFSEVLSELVWKHFKAEIQEILLEAQESIARKQSNYPRKNEEDT